MRPEYAARALLNSPKSERDAIATLELQDLARFVRRRDGEAEPLDDLAHGAHLLGVAAGEPSRPRPQGVLEPDPLVALEKALRGVSLTDLDVYVGVSSGAFVTAGRRRANSPKAGRNSANLIDNAERTAPSEGDPQLPLATPPVHCTIPGPSPAPSLPASCGEFTRLSPCAHGRGRAPLPPPTASWWSPSARGPALTGRRCPCG